VAQMLADRGYKNVDFIAGGFDAWRQANYPLEPK
jgi:rhodanese-related sulfurtransferase